MKISQPTLLIDERIARANIHQMADKANANGALLRPHFKTHQSAAIANWFREAGIHQATVSSVQMARYFAAHGWSDLTIAFPYNPLEVEDIQQLASQIQLGITITDISAIKHLEQHVSSLCDLWIKLDVGTHRTGIEPHDVAAFRLAMPALTTHRLKGFLAHAGHSYRPLTTADATSIFQSARDQLHQARTTWGDPGLQLSYGDTPTCTLLPAFEGIEEIRPGNFVFYDAMQHHFGVCPLTHIAVCMACPIVAVHPQRNELVVYGGAVHLSKDFVTLDTGDFCFGWAVRLGGAASWDAHTPVGQVVRLSQEHGIIRLDADTLATFHIGDVIGILPIHSCLTADLQPYYLSLTGARLSKWCPHGV